MSLSPRLARPHPLALLEDTAGTSQTFDRATQSRDNLRRSPLFGPSQFGAADILDGVDCAGENSERRLELAETVPSIYAQGPLHSVAVPGLGCGSRLRDHQVRTIRDIAPPAAAAAVDVAYRKTMVFECGYNLPECGFVGLLEGQASLHDPGPGYQLVASRALHCLPGRLCWEVRVPLKDWCMDVFSC